MKVAIIYASKNGQTRNIATFIKESIFRPLGHINQIEINECPFSTDLDVSALSADVLFIGTPVYLGRFSKHVVRWCARNRNALNRKTVAFFTVSLNAADQRAEARKTDRLLLRSFIEQSGLEPKYVASIAGALRYREYNFFVRFMLKRISRTAGGPTDTNHDFVMTDWSQVGRFIDCVLKDEAQREFLTSEVLSEDHSRGAAIHPRADQVSIV